MLTIVEHLIIECAAAICKKVILGGNGEECLRGPRLTLLPSEGRAAIKANFMHSLNFDF